MAIRWLDTPDESSSFEDLLDAVRERWPDAPSDDGVLADLLATARTECEAYAPKETDPQHPGEHACRTAQLLHARNIWNAALIAPGDSGGFGNEGFSVSVHPLDWAVTQRLRPSRVKRKAF